MAHHLAGFERATAAIGALVAVALLPSLQLTPGAFAEPRALQRPQAPRAQHGFGLGTPQAAQPLPSGSGGIAAAADALERPSRHGFGLARLATAARVGAVAAMAAVAAALPRRRNRGGQERRPLLGLASAAGGGSFLTALPATFQSFASSNVGLMMRLSTLNFCKIYLAMLVLRITIMWFPNINPYRQPFYSMIQLTDPYLNLFRGWMPPIFGIDLSVILAFVVIQAVIDTLTISPF
mmetsp:Transcript_122476/g.305849  ORF Transcript_122476/g.305849 Transcript_122476/m.305849 type:complete len:237 (+) Transcript_122476:85-795(+)